MRPVVQAIRRAAGFAIALAAVVALAGCRAGDDGRHPTQAEVVRAFRLKGVELDGPDTSAGLGSTGIRFGLQGCLGSWRVIVIAADTERDAQGIRTVLERRGRYVALDDKGALVGVVTTRTAPLSCVGEVAPSNLEARQTLTALADAAGQAG